MPGRTTIYASLLLTASLLFSAPAAAQTTEYDDKSAAIFTYFSVGDDESPESSVTKEQFTQQIEELAEGGYTIIPLSAIADALRNNTPLPPRTIGISFDDADESVLSIAAPILFAHKIPFTVFIAADKISDETTAFLSWDDLRKLKRNDLVSFGIEPASGLPLANASPSEIKRQINNSITKIRDEMDIEPTIFAYPYGVYNPAYASIVKEMGFTAAFAQQSSPAHAGTNLFALPRFMMTGTYGDMDRFRMAANALPLPVTDIAPDDPVLRTNSPAIGFTLPDSLAPEAKKLSCYSSGAEKPQLEFLGSRVEIRLGNVDMDKLRLNCILPYASTTPDEGPRWRWLGLMYIMKDATFPQHTEEQPEIIESHE